MGLAIKNNNPGNLKDPKTGGFRSFSSPQEGYTALMNDLQAKVSGGSSTGLTGDSTLFDFSKTYAPSSDKNNPAQYTVNLANHLKVRPDTKLSELKGRIPDFASAVTNAEDSDFAKQYPLKSNQGFEPTPFSNPKSPLYETPKTQQESSGETPELNFGDQMKSRLQQGATALSEGASGKINPLSAVLQTVGAGAGAVGDVAGDVLNFIPGVKQATDFIGKGVQGLANTGVGKSVVGAGQSFAQEHPELSGDIGAVFNIATAFPILKGFGVAKGLVGRALGKEALSGVIADVAPELGAKAMSKNVAKQGLVKTLLRGEIKPVVEQGVKDIAETVNKYVPNFSKLGTFAEKLNAVRDTVYKLADELKQAVVQSGKDRIYSFKELNSVLQNVERPLMVSSDTTLTNAYNRVIQKALEIAREKGGTISSLFEARKELDQFIAQQFPNLYASEQLTPMRAAVRGIRGAMNDFIEQRLPAGNTFKESLRTQSRLFDAIDNMAPRATKEIGSTSMSRVGARHPLIKGLIRRGVETGVTAAGLAGGYNWVQSQRER